MAGGSFVRTDFSVNGVLAEPFEGASSLGGWGYGVMLLGGVHWRNIPVSLGLDVTGIRWGHSASLLDVQLGDTPAVLEETRTDQTILLDSWLRVQPRSWSVRPYFEGLVGLKLLDTNYSLAFVNGAGSTSRVTDQATASTFGLGAGADFLLANATDDSGSALFATAGVRWLTGSNASFSRAPDVSSVNQVVRFDVPTRTVLVLLGFCMRVQRPASTVRAPTP